MRIGSRADLRLVNRPLDNLPSVLVDLVHSTFSTPTLRRIGLAPERQPFFIKV